MFDDLFDEDEGQTQECEYNGLPERLHKAVHETQLRLTFGLMFGQFDPDGSEIAAHVATVMSVAILTGYCAPAVEELATFGEFALPMLAGNLEPFEEVASTVIDHMPDLITHLREHGQAVDDNWHYID